MTVMCLYVLARIGNVHGLATREYVETPSAGNGHRMRQTKRNYKMKTTRVISWSHMFLVWLALALCGGVVSAQVDTGTILGTVTDSSSAVVPGATVTITNQATSERQSSMLADDVL